MHFDVIVVLMLIPMQFLSVAFPVACEVVREL